MSAFTRAWNRRTSRFEDMPEKMAAFLTEIEEVCKKHDLGIAHEDDHGAFIIVDYRHNRFDADTFEADALEKKG